MLHVIVILVLLLGMGLLLFRALMGPTAYDRILATNGFGTMVMLAIAIFADRQLDPMLLDVALIYGLVNFIATIALLRYFKYGSFDDRD